MNLDTLEEFVSLAEKKSFRETSRKFGISTSAVTKHITTLEKELGVSLFERTTRKVDLTVYGQAFLPYARQILEAMRNSRNVLEELQLYDNSSLTIGMSFLNFSMCGDVLERFKAKFPDCTINFIQAATSTLELMLKNKSCDLAFMRKDANEPLLDKDIRYSIFRRERLAAYIPNDHPLASRSEISISDLRKENLICLSPHSEVHEIALGLCENAGFEPRIVMTNNSRLSCQYMVLHNVGIALLPVRLTGDGPLIPDIQTVYIEPASYINIYVAYIRNNLLLNSVALDFLKFIDVTL